MELVRPANPRKPAKPKLLQGGVGSEACLLYVYALSIALPCPDPAQGQTKPQPHTALQQLSAREKEANAYHDVDDKHRRSESGCNFDFRTQVHQVGWPIPLLKRFSPLTLAVAIEGQHIQGTICAQDIEHCSAWHSCLQPSVPAPQGPA
jgi:hypothetical protein